MKGCYINGIGSVSAQNHLMGLEDFEELTKNVVAIFKPDFKAYIQPDMIRRMSNIIKMGIVSSSIALKEAGVKLPNGIITGTGLGCVKDSEKFLKSIIDNNEQYLTPTSFIQSTHNTVGAQIALGLCCKAYNVTYVHGATSFESSLMDALLMINEKSSTILVGGVDEIGDYTSELYKLIGHIKEEEMLSDGLLNSNSKGAYFSEGSQFFVLQDQKTNESYAELVNVSIYNNVENGKMQDEIIHFLKENDLDISSIDIVMLGVNGDMEYDSIYNDLQDTIFKNTQQMYYKHFCGEYNTASAFGMWAICQILKKQEIPDNFKLNNMQVASIRNVLLYNQYRGKNHSLTLLKRC